MTARASALLFALVAACVCGSAQSPAPVVVELFTSEGCSSCPPADEFLRVLDAKQPFEGTQVIVLGEHVDYWDDQGWRDIYSDHDLTLRQAAYAERLGLKTSYTPQLIVDGASECSGNDRKRAIDVIEKARKQPKVSIQISSATFENGKLRAHVETGSLPERAEVFVALALDHAASQVVRGENSGHRLEHVAVARNLVKAGKAEKGTAFSKDVEIKAKPEGPYRVIAFVQEANQGKILGAAEKTLTAEKATP
jgi:hypothetical protein